MWSDFAICVMCLAIGFLIGYEYQEDKQNDNRGSIG